MTFLVIVTTPTLSVSPSDRLSSILVNSAGKIFRLSLGYHPLDGVTLDCPPTVRSCDATGQNVIKMCST